MTKKFSKNELRRRVEILKSMSYTPSKEEIRDFLSPPKQRTEADLQGYSMVEDDFGVSEEAKKRRQNKA